jgi:hypothetical protein
LDIEMELTPSQLTFMKVKLGNAAIWDSNGRTAFPLAHCIDWLSRQTETPFGPIERTGCAV